MRCVTLFAGAGGADLGLAEAGVEHLACVEVDADCCATLTAAGFPAVRAGARRRLPIARPVVPSRSGVSTATSGAG